MRTFIIHSECKKCGTKIGKQVDISNEEINGIGGSIYQIAAYLKGFSDRLHECHKGTYGLTFTTGITEYQDMESNEQKSKVHK